ncbi:MAG: hypothetical protein GY952_03030 [Rhodobacteraceae bacterium]|nr:hypothetical protein [Paracoccaceae bacterium]
MLLRRLLPLLFVLSTALPLQAQTLVGVFSSYDEMRSAMDDAMVKADITTALLKFDAGVTSKGQALDVQAKFNQLFPKGLPNKALIRRDVYEAGLSRELLAYWNGTKYLWVSILIHDLGEQVVAIEFSANTDYDTIASEF